MCLVHFDLEMCFVPKQRALFRHLRTRQFCAFWPGNVLRATTACTFRHFQKWSEPVRFTLLTWTRASRHNSVHFSTLPKVVRTRQFFTLLTWTCASRHFQKCSEPVSFLHFWLGHVLRAASKSALNPSVLCILTWKILEMCFAPERRALLDTSKSGPNPSVFYTFDLDMCFAPQQRALFDTSKSGPSPSVFYTFDLDMCFAPLLKVLWTRQFFTLLTWKCVSRRNGVQFFSSHLASWLRTRRFSEPTSEATNHGKNAVFRDFPTFSRTWIFFLLRLSLSSSSSSLTLPSSAFPKSLFLLNLVFWLNLIKLQNLVY